MKKSVIRRGCLAFAGILFLLFLYHFNQIEKIALLETGGRSFEKAVVEEIIQDNETENGNTVGNQQVLLRLLTGEYKGETVEATSSSGYLYGAHCTVGMKVIAIVNGSAGE